MAAAHCVLENNNVICCIAKGALGAAVPGVCVGAFNKKYIQRGGHEAAACTNARSLCNTIKIKDASLFS